MHLEKISISKIAYFIFEVQFRKRLCAISWSIRLCSLFLLVVWFSPFYCLHWILSHGHLLRFNWGLNLSKLLFVSFSLSLVTGGSLRFSKGAVLIFFEDNRNSQMFKGLKIFENLAVNFWVVSSFVVTFATLPLSFDIAKFSAFPFDAYPKLFNSLLYAADVLNDFNQIVQFLEFDTFIIFYLCLLVAHLTDLRCFL